MTRGSLRIYLGASPGVGKTFAMLGEGRRRRERGTDVVVGVVETHGRAHTAAQLADMEVLPRRRVEYRGTEILEMDVDGLLARRPAVALVDEYAHTNAPGSRNEKRWQDVEELLAAGIDVIATLNVQHLESLNDVINRITGVVQRETVPDSVVRRADQIELVDMSPEALRRRMAHGNIYPPERIDAALSNYFRPGNLGALRELALLWVADRVEESLGEYLSDHGITESWETRERVVVGLTGRPGGDDLIRRAARMAGRVGGDLIGVHVVTDDGLARVDSESITDQRRLLAELGGTAHEVVGHDRAEALVAFARADKATQLVLGASRQSRWFELWHGSFVAKVTRLAGNIDVHVIAHNDDPEDRRESLIPAPSVNRRRVAAAWALTILGLPMLVLVMVQLRDHLGLPSNLLLALTLVLLVAAIGGRTVAAVAAVAASLLINWFFVEPRNTFTIAAAENFVALVVFVVTAVAVGSLVDKVATRSGEAVRARVEAESLARAAASLAGDPNPMSAIAEQLRGTFGIDAVRLRRQNADGWDIVASSGDVADGASPSATVPLSRLTDSVMHLDVFGRVLSGDDQRVLRVLADQLAVAVENQRLANDAASAGELAAIDAVRTALLQAVSHDLRTPIASIKAMVSGLRDPSVHWTPEQLDEALTTVDEETDRLNRLVGNLLDASRLQSGALAVDLGDVDAGEAIVSALHSLGPIGDSVQVDVDADVPLMRCDGPLLERSLANVISNAIRYAGQVEPVRVTAGRVGNDVHVRVIDRGPGIAASNRQRVMAPFQRLGDDHTVDGVGLGMSIARGFVDAVGGSLTLDDTPGGGLTVTIAIPASP